MPLVDGVVRETLRLWPPGYVSGRRAIDDFEVLGYRIPGGSMVLYSPYITQRLPHIWSDPERFAPERWADGEPVPFSFVPFGGGYRKCIGFALATLELQVLAVRLAQRLAWRLDMPRTRPTGVANFAPKGGVPITVIGKMNGSSPQRGKKPAGAPARTSRVSASTPPTACLRPATLGTCANSRIDAGPSPRPAR